MLRTSAILHSLLAKNVPSEGARRGGGEGALSEQPLSWLTHLTRGILPGELENRHMIDHCVRPPAMATCLLVASDLESQQVYIGVIWSLLMSRLVLNCVQ